MSLLTKWREVAYAKETNEQNGGRDFWVPYFSKEKEVYEKLLKNYENPPKLKFIDFIKEYELDSFYGTGFVDGINDSLTNSVDIENMTEDTEIDFSFDVKLLYKNMVDAKADWLYSLEEWDCILTDEERKELYLEQKKSNTVVKGKKIGRNDPCSCGSGKKYKKCCGC